VDRTHLTVDAQRQHPLDAAGRNGALAARAAEQIRRAGHGRARCDHALDELSPRRLSRGKAVVSRLRIPSKVSILRIVRHGCSPLRAFSQVPDRTSCGSPAVRVAIRAPRSLRPLAPGGHGCRFSLTICGLGACGCKRIAYNKSPRRTTADRPRDFTARREIAPPRCLARRPTIELSAGGNGMSEAKEPWGNLVLVEFDDG